MKRLAILFAVAVLIGMCSASAWAMASEYNTTNPIVQQPDWPAGLADLLKDGKPVYAYWVNWMDHFYYAGDTDSLNAFLEKYSKLQGTPLTVSIHVGPAKVGKITTPGQKDMPYDWHVFITPPMIPDGGIVKGREHERIVTVELWLGGQVELRKIEAPNNIKVVDGNDIAKFISGIEGARKTSTP